MFYTLLKFLGWGLLLAFVGGCVGWALRALKCRGEIAQARATTTDDEEVDRMRHRLANLEQVVAERDRLRMQVADMRHADSPGVVGAPVDDLDDAGSEPRADAADVSDSADGDAVVPDAAETTVADAVEEDDTDDVAADDASGSGDDAAEEVSEVAPLIGLRGETADATERDARSDEEPDPSPALDVDAAAEVLGKRIRLDDLTVVEGIGPKIAELCNAISITTWRELAATEVDELQSMLDAAGSRFSVHKPGTWPQQAELLAAGRWEEFKALTDQLDGGR